MTSVATEKLRNPFEDGTGATGYNQEAQFQNRDVSPQQSKDQSQYQQQQHYYGRENKQSGYPSRQNYQG